MMIAKGDAVMATKFEGEFDTYTVKRCWISARPDGLKALLVETNEGQTFALSLPPEVLPKLAADLATLSALPKLPNKPNA
jgi:hypothetical protein